MTQELSGQGRWAWGLAALSLLILTHRGGSMNEEAIASEAQGSRAPVTRTQELLTALTFSPSADARVEAALPTTNFGSASSLGADLSPRMERSPGPWMTRAPSPPAPGWSSM